MRRLKLLLLMTAWALNAAAGAGTGAGTSVSVGGALRDDNAVIWRRIVELAGGPGARFVVLATASAEPEATATKIVANLQRHGALAEALPVAPMISGIDPEALNAAVRDPRWIARVQAARGVFFSGGAQARLADTLQPGGRATPLLQAIHALFERGGVVAGTSSGMAVMSTLMFRDAPDVLAAMKQPLRDGIEVDRGFGFVPEGVLVDQHFLRRGRIGRLLPLMVARGIRIGLGVEEDSAAVVSGNQVEVLGPGVLVVDLHDARRDASQGPFNIAGARLHLLEDGDGYDLATRHVRSGKADSARLDAAARAARGCDDGDALTLQMLAPGALAGAMTRLVHDGGTEALGLSFDPRPAAVDAQPELGFEWRLHRAADTVAWSTGGCAGGTVADLRLDVQPVRVALPLYRPWRAPP